MCYSQWNFRDIFAFFTVNGNTVLPFVSQTNVHIYVAYGTIHYDAVRGITRDFKKGYPGPESTRFEEDV